MMETVSCSLASQVSLLHKSKLYNCISLLIATQVVIGLEETEYSIPETTTSQVVCANVESGSTVGRNIEIRYVVSDSGVHFSHCSHAIYILVDRSYTYILHCHS